jgi:anti-sigma-K factor RskA
VNVKEYISSGIIESYVLGLASVEERADAERIFEQYPEVMQARIAFELALEQQAMQNAVQPPVELKQKIAEAALGSAKVIPLEPVPVRRINWLRYAVAASVVLLAGSLYWNISLYNSNKELQGDYRNSIAKLDDLEKQLSIIRPKPQVKMVAMKGMEPSPASFATVYWDTTSKDVYLLVNNLPQPPSDKQYQLWALFNGQPVDMGMIDNEFFTGTKKQLLLQMKNATHAQAFAITLEKKGGSTTPLGDMYVMGNL